MAFVGTKRGEPAQMSDMRRRDFITLIGGAAAWPLAARAQQAAVPVVGFLSSRSPEESAHLVEAFRGGLKDGGFIEGQSVSLEFRWARGDYDRLPALATELVNRRVSMIAAVGDGRNIQRSRVRTRHF